MQKFLTGLNYNAAVQQLFESGGPQGTLSCAVAFWGADADRYLPLFGRGTRIICNLESGATNPYVIAKLREKRIQVRTLADLHAKVYIGPTLGVVGSANCSANGLSVEESEGWIEAGLQVHDKATLEKLNDWFVGLWKKGVSVEDRHIHLAKQRWKARQRMRPSRTAFSGDLSLKKAILEAPGQLRNRDIYFAMVTITQLTKEGERAAELAGWGDAEVYEDWDKLPTDAYLIEGWVEKGTADIKGLCKTYPKHPVQEFQHKRGEPGTLIHVRKIRDIAGFQLMKADRAFWRDCLWEIHEQFAPESDDGSYVVRLEKALPVIQKWAQEKHR